MIVHWLIPPGSFRSSPQRRFDAAIAGSSHVVSKSHIHCSARSWLVAVSPRLAAGDRDLRPSCATGRRARAFVPAAADRTGPAAGTAAVDAGRRSGGARVRCAGRAVRAWAPRDRYRGAGGELVRSPTAGRVAFAGPVAGANWVSLLVAPEVLVTVGPLSDPVTTAEQVRSRAPVGRVGSGHALPTVGRTGPGREGATLHLSVRVDGVYVDPLAYLIDRPRPRLAPLSAPGGLGGG